MLFTLTGIVCLTVARRSPGLQHAFGKHLGGTGATAPDNFADVTAHDVEPVRSICRHSITPHHCITASPHHRIAASRLHRIVSSLLHRFTASPFITSQCRGFGFRRWQKGCRRSGAAMSRRDMFYTRVLPWPGACGETACADGSCAINISRRQAGVDNARCSSLASNTSCTMPDPLRPHSPLLFARIQYRSASMDGPDWRTA